MESLESDRVGEQPIEAAEAHVGESSVRAYLAVGVVLAVSTLIEVQLPTWLAGNPPVKILALLGSAFFKAGLVALFYMHLKGDSRAYSGIVALALLLVAYFAVLLTFGQFGI